MLSFFKKKPKEEKSTANSQPQNSGRADGYTPQSEADLIVLELVDALFNDALQRNPVHKDQITTLASYVQITKLSNEGKGNILPSLVRYALHLENRIDKKNAYTWIIDFVNKANLGRLYLVSSIVETIVRHKLSVSTEMLDAVYIYPSSHGNWEKPKLYFSETFKCTIAGEAKVKGILTPQHIEYLKRDFAKYQATYKPNPKLIVRFEQLLGETSEYQPITTDPLGHALARTLRAEPDKPWGALFLFLHQTQGKPSAKALKQVAGHLENIGHEAFLEQFSEWTRIVVSIPVKSPDPQQPIYSLLAEPNQQLMNALVTLAGTIGTAETATEIAQLAAKAMTKIPGLGPAATGLGNQCIRTLAAMPGGVGLFALAGLAPKLKQAPKPTQAIFNRELEAAATRAGTTVAALQDSLVPTFDMAPDATATHSMGPYTATLRAKDLRSAELSWSKDSKPLKSLPAGAKSDFPEETAYLKAQQKELQTALATLRDRLDSSYLNPTPVPFADFHSRWLAHPLLGAFARALIWRVTPADAPPYSVMWGIDGASLSANGDTLPFPAADAAIELWHPLHSATEETLAWRTHLEEAEVVQPIKQAFREVYVVTPAELYTNTYSNRMAAHILRQHQFNALAKLRGWSFPLQGAWDGNQDSIARCVLSHWGLEAQYWVDGVWGEGNDWQQYTVDSGVLRYVATDQIRFIGTDGQVRTMAEIPPVVFSEVMRDADLFVGVASVGNNPNWQDAGPEARFHDYWQSYSFGDLTATANNRKELLQRLIPRLAIASKCSFTDKFLVVRGTKRVYKIHLGSGNIMMEPGDRYLCIVPGRSHDPAASNRVFLPFEGDAVFSIILSKAVLLAADDKITDESILRQLVY